MKKHTYTSWLFIPIFCFVLGCQTASEHSGPTSKATAMEVATATHTQAVAARQEPIPAVAVEPVAIPAQESTSLASSVEVKSAPIEVTRVETALEGPALKMLKETDELLSLSDTQYNELVALMEARQVEWKALMAKQKVLTDTEFNGRKKALFGGYSKRMMALFTPEQLKLWRNR